MLSPTTSRFFLGALSAAAVGLAVGRDCNHVCFTSFNPCEGTCTFAQHAYPQRDTKNYPMGEPLIILTEYEYPLAWKDADPAYPLLIAWLFQTPNVTSKYTYTPAKIRWAVNISSPEVVGTYIWKPTEVLAEFPTIYSPNMTAADALAHASMSATGYITISQPEKDQNAADGSTDFALQSRFAEQALRAQYDRGHREEHSKWQLGVGIAVGLGVPTLIVAFWVLGYRQGKRGTWDWRKHAREQAKSSQ